MPKKTIIMGLGGTGDWVLTFLKSRLYSAYGEQEVKRDVQFLLVDTIHAKTRESAFVSDNKKFQVQSVIDQHEEEVAHLGEVRVESNEYLALTGEIHSVAASIQEGQDAHTKHLNWFTADYYLRALPAAAMNITDGAGQWRQFGRLALVLSAERGEFSKRVERLIEAANVPAGDSLMFYLVSSLAGGTGAGTILDAAALVRDIATKAGKKVWVVGFLVLPSAFSRVLGDNTMRVTEIRSFAAYRELLRFQTQAGQGVPFGIQYSLNKRVSVTTKLFDTVFLFDASTDWRDLSEVPPWSGISPSIADGLEVFIDRTAGSGILQDLINASARMAAAVRLEETLPAQFHTLGSHKIVLPARQYAAIFSSRFVIEFLKGVFPTSDEGGLPALRKANKTDAEYREFGIEFMRKVPNLFTRIVDLLPEAPDSVKKLKAFSGLRLDDYRSLMRPKSIPQGVDLQLLTRNPLAEIQTGGEAGDTAEDAAKRITNECKRRLEAYWQRLDLLKAAIIEQLEREIPVEVHHQARQILNGQVPEFSDHTLGSTLAFLRQVVLVCDDLSSHVLAQTARAIDDQNSRQNSLGHWETQVSLSQTNMEATRGYDGFLRRNRAWNAQKEYLKVQSDYVERRKLNEVFDVFSKIVAILREAAAGLASQLQGWADTATLSDKFSARSQAEADIAEITAALLRGGETYTSSYGLNAYTKERPVDPTMGGYQEVLYQRFAKPLIDQWLESLEWDLKPTQDENNEGGFELSLRVKQGGEGLELTAGSGKDLSQRIFDQARREIAPKVTSLSVFDYFLNQGLTPRQVADFFKDHTGPLIGSLTPTSGSVPVRHTHLLAQEPANTDAVNFLQELRRSLVNIFDEAPLQTGQQQDFDNPYTITLLYLVQDIREGQLQVMNQYEGLYADQLVESDTHVINHVFCCEQEAAKIEKQFMITGGIRGAWPKIHPRIVRLLDNPLRLQLFLQLWAMDIVRLQSDPEDAVLQVWMLLPPGNDDPTGTRVPWLTKPDPTGGSRGNLSILLAIEQFCFVERSARPGRTIPIEYTTVEKAYRQKRNELIDVAGGRTDYSRLRAHYEAFLESLPARIEEGCTGIHSEREAHDLDVVARHYVTRELDGFRDGRPGGAA